MPLVEFWTTSVTPARQYKGKNIGEALRHMLDIGNYIFEHRPDMAIYVKNENKTMVRLRLLVEQSHIDDEGVIHIAAYIDGVPARVYHFHFDPRFGSVRRGINTPRINMLTLGYPQYESSHRKEMVQEDSSAA